MLLGLRSLWEGPPGPPPTPPVIPTVPVIPDQQTVGGRSSRRFRYMERLRRIEQQNEDDFDIVRVITEFLSRL